MCQALRELMKDDLEKQFVAGKEAGREAGKEEARLSAIKSLMQTMHLTADAAMKVLQIPDNEQSRYKGMLNL